jgi:hypothetical protein
MRLINVHSLQLREFAQPPFDYAILSHRWTEDEINYKDFARCRNESSLGYWKAKMVCEFIQSCNKNENYPGPIEWAWVDTCCIDKRSSAELSEAINSMWKWYRSARYCVAYLADVPSFLSGQEEVFCRFKTSKWFTRGWTLQELLAPNLILFCNVAWEQFGLKHDSMAYGEVLTDIIASVTGIPNECLQRPGIARGACFAQKLSWASQRQTTRGEDVVYCLLGLLDVNMPLLYGEGLEKAFFRLQKEFIQDSDDESIFLWDRPASTRSMSVRACCSQQSADL